MTKKLLSILLTIVMVLSIAPVAVFAENDILDYLSYEIVDGEVTITDCDESISGEVVIPDTIEGYPVTAIGEQAFSFCNELISVVIPQTITVFGVEPFLCCYSMSEVYFNNSCETVISEVLYETSVKNIYLGENFKTVVASSTNGPGKLISLGSLETISVDENNNYYSSVSGVLFSKDKTELLCFPDNCKIKNYIIPEGVKCISSFAFSRVNIEVVFPESLETIEENAFENSFDLLYFDKVVFYKNMESIKKNAFNCIFFDSVIFFSENVEFEDESIGYSNYVINGDKSEFRIMYDSFIDAVAAGDDEKANSLVEKIQTMLIYNEETQADSNLTIHGYAGSTAETYANENGFSFVALCRHNYVDTVITAPTYTQTGEGGMVCEHCGDVQSTYEIPMLEIEDSEEEKDEDTGVSVIFPDGTFDEDAEIEITPVEEGEAYKLISHKQGNYKVTMFDINVTVDGQKVQPNGTVLVKIPLPKGYNQNKCVVYYVADDGTMEELKTYHYKDGYVYFETDHFSYYAVVEEASDKPGWMDESLSFIDRLIAFFNMIMNFFKRIFGMV